MKLVALSADELSALRRDSLDDDARNAGRQAAFEKLWHRVSLPSGTRRHALREALGTIASIYATQAVRAVGHQSNKQRYTFEKALRQCLEAERRMSQNKGRSGQVEKALTQLCDASPAARDVVLDQLVQHLVTESASAQVCRIDFADLLLDVAAWNDPVNPTPQRWYELVRR